MQGNTQALVLAICLGALVAPAARAVDKDDIKRAEKAGVEFLPLPADAPSLHDLLAQFDRQ